MENVKRTTEVFSHIGRACEHCHASIGYSSRDEGISDSINHYIQEHGYQLLHVGTQTSESNEGKLWHNTVAILGHDNPPAILPLPKIMIGGKEI